MLNLKVETELSTDDSFLSYTGRSDSYLTIIIISFE